MGFSGDFESRGRKTAGRAKRLRYCRVFGARIEEHAPRAAVAGDFKRKGRGSLRAPS
jgi:hypothetical protein